MKRSSQIMQKKYFHDDDVIDDVTDWPQIWPSIFLYKRITFFMITKQRAKISSFNFLCICIMRLWLQSYKYIFMTSLMTSRGQKMGQISKLIYLRQYFSYSVDQKLKVSEMFMAIFLVYSTSGITSGKKSFTSSKWRPFWNFWNIKHSFNLTSDMKRSSQVMPKKFFMVMMSSMTPQGGLKVYLYIHV